MITLRWVVIGCCASALLLAVIGVSGSVRSDPAMLGFNLFALLMWPIWLCQAICALQDERALREKVAAWTVALQTQTFPVTLRQPTSDIDPLGR